MNPNVLRAIAAIFAVLVIGGAIYTRTGGNEGDPKSAARPVAPSEAVYVDIAYSPEKERLLTKAIQKFNDRRAKIDGKTIVVRGSKVSSGAAYDGLKAKSLKPTIWTPSSSFWGSLLTESADVKWIPAKSASFVRTPLVIAMWEQQAKVLGWPKKQLGWADILREARDPQGFARYGHPEWGQFRLGQTNPDFSTSGLSAVAAQYLAATGKSEGLTVADIEDSKVREQVRGVQSSIVHYGDTTLFFAEQMAKGGPAYASAVAMEETTLVDFNTRLRSGGQKLVAIYPKEGTFYSDNPLIVLDAPWVTGTQKQAAKEFIDYLLSAKVQRDVGKDGFRPSDVTAKPAKRLSAKVGVDTSQPKVVLSVPGPPVLARVKELWKEDRKPADVVIVLDTSGSMLDANRLVSAQRGLRELVSVFGPRDRAALLTFADTTTQVTELTEMSPTARKELQSRIDGLFAQGGTAFYDATDEAVRLLSEDGDPTHIRAAVVLTDGQDNRSTQSLDSLEQKLGGGAGAEAGAQQPVRVFTIAYSVDDLVANQLERISAASGGKAYSGDPTTIREVFTSISSFF